MSRKKDQTYRQWILLRAIPREPHRKSTKDLHQALVDEGYDVTLRSVQRDLIDLSAQFGFTDDVVGRASMWFWPKDFKVIDVPGIDPATALVFLMAERHLSDALPTSAMRVLAPYFETARAVMTEEGGNRYREWSRKVRKLPRGPGLAIPKILPDVLETVETALINRRTLRLTYQRRGDRHTQIHEVDPRGLVMKDGLSYLVGTYGTQLPPYHFAVHRIMESEVLETSIPRLPDFDLDEYIHSVKAFDYPRNEDTLSLKLRVTDWVRFHLEERPLSNEQKLGPVDAGGHCTVTAKVSDTSELRWWLLAHGKSIEVVQPVSLRREIADAFKSAAEQYVA
jgi:hypothetical protein